MADGRLGRSHRPSRGGGVRPCRLRRADGAILFTGRRILLVQREHLLEARTETSSYPYRSVRHFSIQEGESGDSRSTVRIWLGDEPQPLHLRANPATDLRPLQRLLADRLV